MSLAVAAGAVGRMDQQVECGRVDQVSVTLEDTCASGPAAVG
jgi:hypothetical protein